MGAPTTNSKFGAASSKFILDDVRCTGTEQTLFDCQYEPTDNCGSYEAAGVICSGKIIVLQIRFNTLNF